jgi:HAD superfamily 5'-nucleotidase-like hydrolase
MNITRLLRVLKPSVLTPSCTLTTKSSMDNLIDLYTKSKSHCLNDLSYFYNQVNPNGVFANNELDLNEIEIYGFDYDYTLAHYNRNLFQVMFNLGRNSLVSDLKYPSELFEFNYMHDYPVRGIHFDKRNGWLMKIDSYHNIQLGTVHSGTKQISDKDVKKFYNGIHINIEHIGYTQTSKTMHQFIDLFCLPEIALLSAVIENFQNKNIQFSPDYVYEDVKSVMQSLHRTEILHKTISQSLGKFIVPTYTQAGNEHSPEGTKIKELLRRIKKSNKNTFLITNSKYWFVNLGMTYICGPDWHNLFDVIICNARKPDFFNSKSRPFRHYLSDVAHKSWDRVTKFEKGQVYYEGNLFELLQFTGWHNKKTLYFGDNLYSDLAEPFLKHGWRTGGIIRELKYEINTINGPRFQSTVAWLVSLERLLQELMLLNTNDLSVEAQIQKRSLEDAWFAERELLKKQAKVLYNPYFGSIFRAHNNPSFFSRRLSRFADIYTANITNLLEYPLDYHFIPRHVDLAHENRTSINLFNL